MMSDQERIWIIWSNDQGLWRRPGSLGHTQAIDFAERYSYADAKKICDEANGHQTKRERPNEVMTLSPEASIEMMGYRSIHKDDG